MFPIPAILGSAGLEGLVREYITASGHSAWALWIPGTRDQQAKKRVTILADIIVPNQQVEAGLLLHNGGREDYV